MHPLRNITLGFTTFRPESIPFAAAAMTGHQLILLEEPQTPGFEAMLAGELDVDEYILLSEFEFPQYARAQAQLLRTLHGQGAIIRQVHPWMDELISIHEFFAAGNGPKDLPQESPCMPVYRCEHLWTKALMAFYTASGSRDFDAILESIRAFAKADAAKISDMDNARATAVAAVLDKPEMRRIVERGKIYVECGGIHHTMILYLHRLLGPGRCRVLRLLEEKRLARHGKRLILAPGDILTFRYLLGAPSKPPLERLLAARTLVYNKLTAKQEMLAEQTDPFPHMDDEMVVISAVSALSYDECRDLWRRIRNLPSAQARAALLQGAH